MSFSEQPPSKQWAALKFRGETLAEVWFKPEGEPYALTFRIPRQSFQIPGMGQRLTAENLLRAVGVAAEEVESWSHEGASDAGIDGPSPDLSAPLPQTAQDVTYLTVYVRLKPPQAAARDESSDPGIALAKWQDLEARWKAILGLEASMDTLRISMEGLRAEMDAASKAALSGEEKLHALAANVAQWNKGKSRVHHVVPRAREYIHRATWALGTPERKRLEEFFKEHNNRPDGPLPPVEEVQELLENVLKDRQVLSAHGMTVYQECKSVLGNVQAALMTLRRNAAANATRKRGASAKGKSF